MHTNPEFPTEQEEVNKFFKFLKGIYKANKGDKDKFIDALKKNRTLELGDEESYAALYDITKDI